jgi:CarD family transcriptional regulator
MMLTVGRKVVYPHRGPCLVRAVVEKKVGGNSMSFYHLAPLDDSGALFVPVDKISGSGVRQLIERAQIPRLLRHLEKPASIETNWKQRAIDNVRLLTSGSAFDLAEIIESLTELNETRTLSPRDRQTLERARRILVCEISEVMGETKSAAEAEVDKALNIRKN